MSLFEINGKEYELKLTFESIIRLNKSFEGGSYELIGKALAGDLEAFPKIVHAGLLHTGENFSMKDVSDAINTLIENEQMSFDDIQRIGNEVVTDSFFYRPTVQKMMKNNPEMKRAYEQLMG